MKTLRAGMWGGRHVALRAGVAGAATRLDYDCAHGTIDGPLTLDAAGRFEWRGRHVAESGGPSREIVEVDGGSPPQAAGRAAIYKGRLVNGRELTLTVTFADTGERIGTFSLAHGREPEITRCY